MKKWWGVIVLAVIGVVALVFGIIYLTESLHQLPSFLGGTCTLNKAGHCKRGNHHSRGIVLIVVCLVCFGFAGYLAWRNQRSGTGSSPAGGQSTTGESSSELLGGAQ